MNIPGIIAALVLAASTLFPWILKIHDGPMIIVPGYLEPMGMVTLAICAVGIFGMARGYGWARWTGMAAVAAVLMTFFRIYTGETISHQIMVVAYGLWIAAGAAVLLAIAARFFGKQS